MKVWVTLHVGPEERFAAHTEEFDLATLIGTSQEAQDGCDPCEFGTELLGLIINMSKELD